MMTDEIARAICELQDKIGYAWRDVDLIREALTHSTYGNANGLSHNQRLEFLGDAVLDMVTAEWLMVTRPHAREGAMSQERAQMIQASALASRARELGLDRYLILKKSDEYLRQVESVLADVMEAVIGSVWLDCRDFHRISEVVIAAGIIS